MMEDGSLPLLAFSQEGDILHLCRQESDPRKIKLNLRRVLYVPALCQSQEAGQFCQAQIRLEYLGSILSDGR